MTAGISPPLVAAASPSVDDEQAVVRVVWGPDLNFDQGVLLRRVIAELELRGFGVRVIAKHPGEEAPSGLGLVFLGVGPDDGPSLYWLPSGEPRDLGVSVAVRSGDDASEIAAVQVAELVVATFENAASSEPPTEALDLPAAPATPPEPAPPRPKWRLSAGFGLLVSPGGLGVFATPLVSASWSFGDARRFGVGLDAAASVLRPQVQTATRAHRIGLAAVRAHGIWWARPWARVSPSVGLGGGTLIAWADPGAATAVGLVSAMGELSVGLTRHLAVFGGARLGFALPRVEVRVQQDVRATAGRPLFDAALGLRVRG